MTRTSDLAPFPDPEALGFGEAPAPPPPDPNGCARCFARWPRPGPCDWCASRIPPEPPNPDRLRSRLRDIPEPFRDVSWANLASLRGYTGGPRVRLPGSMTPALVQESLARHRRAVLLGAAGTGKTTIAGAYARGHLAAGVDRVRWFTAPELLENRPRESRSPVGGTVLPTDLAESADVLVLDDLGAELEGAPPGGGLAAQRVGPCTRVLAARFDKQAPTLVTTGFEPDDLGRWYGDRIKRRLFEGAAVVRLG